jgi:hypothetical protein
MKIHQRPLRLLLTGLSFCLCFMLLSACSTLHSKAQQLYDEHAYEEAQRIYLEILQSDHNDTKALIGLKRTREGLISKKLIEIRQHRFGGNTEQAAEELRKVLLELKDWSLYPSGAVAFTQSEETEYAVRSLMGEVSLALQLGHPLRAAYLLDHYHLFFQGRTLPLLERLHKDAAVRGLERCRSGLQSADPTFTYLREFLSKVCIFWGDPKVELKKPLVHDLFNKFVIRATDTQLSDSLRVRLEIDLQNLFTESPWYDPMGPKSLSLNYSSRYAFKTDRRAAIFTHAYQEQEPYTATEWVTKHRSHPVSVTKSFTQADGKVGTLTTTEYQDETYSESETVTRMRTVTKSFEYNGTEISQDIALRSEVRAGLTSEPAVLTAAVTDRNATAESQTEIPSQGLYARTAKVYDENVWFTQILGQWHKQNLEQLRALWRNLYCRGFSSDASTAQQGNTVFRCLRTSDSAPEFVQSWLNSNEGIDFDQLRSIIK